MNLKETQQAWVGRTLEKTARKLEKVAVRSADKIPYTTINGIHDDLSRSRIDWWTNGFWGGIMWQMYTLTGQEIYRHIAEKNEEKLDACLMRYEMLDHDNGFRWLPTAVADYRVTHSPASRNRGLLAASHLAGRYNSSGHFIRAWNNWSEEDRTGWAIIDCMMNLPLLYWAQEELKDPRFGQIAVKHAEKTMEFFIREDGSAHHILHFDPRTGEKVESLGGQGIENGSSWTRGQSWGLYGFTLSYLHTKNSAFLNTAQRIARYFMDHIPDSGLIPVDFKQPKEVRLEDSSAAAIASCGLIELAKLIPGEQGEEYLNAALKLLTALSEKSCNWKEEEDNLLTKCTGSYHGKDHEISIIYGDYFFLEALMKLAGKALWIW